MHNQKPDAWMYEVDRGHDYGPFTDYVIEEPVEADFDGRFVGKVPLYLAKPCAETEPSAWMYRVTGEEEVSFSSTAPESDGFGEALSWSKPLYSPPFQAEVEKLRRENRRLREQNDKIVRSYALALRHHEQAGREAAAATEAAQAEAAKLRNAVEFTLTDSQRLLRASDVEGVCPHVEDCFHYSDIVRCGPCGARKAAALGVAANEGIPNLPEVSRLRRALAAAERELEGLRPKGDDAAGSR